MIEIYVKYSGDSKQIIEIRSNGHAEYDEYGSDIVCAGVSAILIGGINAIDEYKLISNIKYEVAEGHVLIKVKNYQKELGVILDTLVIQLKTIQLSYSDYVSIMEV